MRYLIAAAAALSVITGPVAAQRDFSNVEIKTTEVVPGIYMLEGAGGNLGLSVGEDGAFLIDDQFAPLSDKIIAAIKEVTDKPVEFVLNTHHHGDHTGGNEAFGAAGAHIVAHDNVRKRLAAGSVTAFGETPPAPEGALPVITFSKTVTLHRNGHEIHVFHPKNAHTDGDAIVFFRNANVMHMGDVLFSGTYPYIDTGAAGTIQGYIAALDAAAAMANAETKVIPGHGPLSGKTEIEALSATLKEVQKRVQALIDEGLDEDAVVAADPLADLNETWGQSFINGEFMTRIAYKSLAGE